MRVISNTLFLISLISFLFSSGCKEPDDEILYSNCHFGSGTVSIYNHPRADSIFFSGGFLSELDNGDSVKYNNISILIGLIIGDCSEPYSKGSIKSGYNSGDFNDNLHRLLSDTLKGLNIISNSKYDDNHLPGQNLNDLIQIRYAGYVSEDNNGIVYAFPFDLNEFISNKPIGYGYFWVNFKSGTDLSRFHTLSIQYSDSYSELTFVSKTIIIKP